jgi:hypothetical protein
MDERDVVRDLVSKLMEAVEASLDGSPAVREALDELARNGFDPRLIVLADATARASGEESADDDEASETAEADPAAEAADEGEDDLEEARDLRYEMTKLDRDFLRTVRIQPESG